MLLFIVMLTGCAGVGPSGHKATQNRLGISWIDRDWRVCEEGIDCPRPSPKTLAPPAATIPSVALPMQTMPVVPAEAIQPDPLTVHFEFGQSRPTLFGAAELDAALALARTAEAIRITGYTDALGSPAGNERLARQRAAFVADWLKQHGVTAPTKIVARGHCFYVASNETAAGRAANRRVVVESIPHLKENHE
jgi:outer membrane protein OmpA-like peptidoglycan-associated protein